MALMRAGSPSIEVAIRHRDRVGVAGHTDEVNMGKRPPSNELRGRRPHPST
jgi:hypothetical protein